jgi:hypothetical protein
MTNDRELDIAYFVAFCIEQYKHRHGMGGRDVANTFAALGISSYLADCYDVLHTQSPRWIMEEIEEVIEKRRKEEAV